MALEGALLGAVVNELLKEVLDATKKVIHFKPSLKRLESTLKDIAPRLDAISCLKKQDQNFDLKQNELEELVVLVNKGKELVRECSNISKIHVFKILEHSNQLLHLDDSLKAYFTKILPLDQYRYVLEIFIMMSGLLEKILGNGHGLHSINGGSSSQSKSESVADMPKKKEEEAVKSYPENAGKVYVRTGKKLFLLKGCPYDFDVEDLENSGHHEVLGKGSYGTSYKCDTKYGAVVIKMLNPEVKVGEREFEERMEVIGKVGSGHPNIMVPIGYYYSELDKFLLYEYAPKGSFKALLKEGKLFQWIRTYWNPRLKIAIGVARGISHIHSQGGVIHGNIKSSNVLLTEDLNGCISDFGLAPIMNFPPTTSKKPGLFAPEYNAPELKETMEATQKSDVYYFGVMLFETVPTYGIRRLWHPNVLSEMVKVLRIVSDCIRKDPNMRPKMDEVVRMLQNIRLDLSKVEEG